MRLLALAMLCSSVVVAQLPDMNDILKSMQLSQAPGQKSALSVPGVYQIEVAQKTFSCAVHDQVLNCLGVLPTNANLAVKFMDVDSRAQLPLVEQNVLDVYKSEAHFQVLVPKEETSVDGQAAIRQVVTYDLLGNVTLPLRVETYSVLANNKLLQLEMRCMSRVCSEYQESVDAAVKSWRINVAPAPSKKAKAPKKPGKK